MLKGALFGGAFRVFADPDLVDPGAGSVDVWFVRPSYHPEPHEKAPLALIGASAAF